MVFKGVNIEPVPILVFKVLSLYQLMVPVPEAVMSANTSPMQ